MVEDLVDVGKMRLLLRFFFWPVGIFVVLFFGLGILVVQHLLQLPLAVDEVPDRFGVALVRCVLAGVEVVDRDVTPSSLEHLDDPKDRLVEVHVGLGQLVLELFVDDVPDRGVFVSTSRGGVGMLVELDWHFRGCL